VLRLERDYIEKNREFLENSHMMTFDYGDKERVDLANLGLPIGEIMFIAFLRSIRKDLIKTNLSIIAGFEGRHRSGKSVAASTWGYILDPTFWNRMEHRIVKTPQELMREIKIIRDEDIHGAVIIIDEGGVVVPNDEYFSEWYKTLSRVFQMFGYLNPCIFFCALNREAIGAKFRKLFNFIISAKRKSNEYSNLSAYELSYNPMFRKYFNRLPKFQIAGHEITLKRIHFGKPPDFIIQRYKNISTIQKDTMLDDMSLKMEELGKPKEVKKDLDLQPIIEHVVKNFNLYTSKRSKPSNIILDLTQIQMRTNPRLARRNAEFVKKEAESILQENLEKENSPREPIIKGNRSKLIARRMEDMIDGPVVVSQEENEDNENNENNDEKEEDKGE
jgi:hypothetical protein